MANHHPDEALLLDYVAGSAPHAVSVLVATHLALCPLCRQTAAEMEAVAGAMLDGVEPVAMSASSAMAVLERIDSEGPVSAPIRLPRSQARSETRVATDRAAVALVPQPLRSVVGADFEQIGWRRVMKGLEVFDLPLAAPGEGGGIARLMRVAGGMGMPNHSHRGEEMNLVLAGGFSDEKGHYLRGDLAVSDASVTHQPVADEGEPCVLYVVTTAPLRLSSPIARVLSQILRV